MNREYYISFLLKYYHTNIVIDPKSSSTRSLALSKKDVFLLSNYEDSWIWGWGEFNDIIGVFRDAVPMLRSFCKERRMCYRKLMSNT